MRLAGSVAVISGGMGDIGRAIALALLAEGAAVALGDVRPTEDAAPFCLEQSSEGKRVVYTQVDVSDPEAVRKWLDWVEEEVGVPNLIIPNAATFALKSIREVTAEEWQRDMAVNLHGAFYMAQYGAGRLLAHHRTGRIVFVGSWAAYAIHPSLPAYCVSKAGVHMLMRCLALDLAPAGIIVNEVAPGYVDGGLSARIFKEYPQVRAQAESQVPTHELTDPKDVARHVAYLCDPETKHLVGMTLLMDGGLSLVTPASLRDA